MTSSKFENNITDFDSYIFKVDLQFIALFMKNECQFK